MNVVGFSLCILGCIGAVKYLLLSLTGRPIEIALLGCLVCVNLAVAGMLLMNVERLRREMNAP